MAKIAILVPYQEMCALAGELVGEYGQLTPMCVEYSHTEQIESRAKELVSQGCELIIARGVQASIAKHSVKLPVVEIRVTTQELGMTVLTLKKELDLPCPSIGLVGFANMICDTSHFDELFGVMLHSYLVKSSSEMVAAVDSARRDGCEAVVGGDIVCSYARRVGLLSGFMPAGGESIRNALETASRVGYAIDLEKHNSAEMNTMLNYTFNGIMQVDRLGNVQRINRAGYDLLERLPEDLLGCPLTQVIPNFSAKILTDTLKDGKETYALVIDINRKTVVINLAPIVIDGEIEGALLTFQEGRRIIEMDSELRRELYQRGYIAKYTFETLPAAGKEMSAVVTLARRIAKHQAPVLLTGESGVGKGLVAQCLHNESLAHGNAFVPLDCSAWLPETLDTMLFGNYTTKKDTPACMVELAQSGTLYLSHVEALPFETQYKLLNLIQGKFLHNGSNRPVVAQVRVVSATSVNLSAKAAKGEFRGDLYYALSVLTLEIPPLRRRRDDILPLTESYLEDWQERYQRYIHLTQGAQTFLMNYDWPGNLNQLNGICERMVLLTEKRNIDEVFLRLQVEQIEPKTLPGTEKVVLYKDPRAVEITALLKKYGGSREKVAAELGVSKTTLWRYIKKYGIEPDYLY